MAVAESATTKPLGKKCCDHDKNNLLSLDQIKEKYNFDFCAQLRDCEKVESDELVLVLDSDKFNLQEVGIQKHVPNTKQYLIFEYRSPTSRRVIRLLSCRHENCEKVFRKWHNFFDHLRIHT